MFEGIIAIFLLVIGILCEEPLLVLASSGYAIASEITHKKEGAE